MIDRRRNVRRCVDAGTVPEGAPCLDAEFADCSLSCAPGLVCWSARCRAACRGDADCGSGACVKVNGADHACVASCRTDADCRHSAPSCVGLQAGSPKVCITQAAGQSECRPDDETSCKPGQRCDVSLVRETLLSRCRAACDDGAPCGAGALCVKEGGTDKGTCLKAVDADAHLRQGGDARGREPQGGRRPSVGLPNRALGDPPWSELQPLSGTLR